MSKKIQKDSVGLYLWSSPTTLRMISLKYFNPRMDTRQILSSYDYEYLKRAKEILSVTDVWVTGYWGFSEETDREALEFLKHRMDNFKKLGLRVHVYMQGPNLVKDSYAKSDWWARDVWGRNVYYHRGRLVCCINNEEYREFALRRIGVLADLSGVTGIYLDNPQVGALGIPLGDTRSNTPGCFCEICRGLFKNKYGCDLPNSVDSPIFNEYLDFRSYSLGNFVQSLSIKAKSKGKIFGLNVYDPKYDLKYITGCDMDGLSKYVDYFMFEVINKGVNNLDNGLYGKIASKLSANGTNVFVLNYKRGIGKDAQPTNTDIDKIKKEDLNYDYYECIKGCEYVTNGVWHNLRLDALGDGGLIESKRVAGEPRGVFLIPRSLRLALGIIAAYFLPYYFNNYYIRRLSSMFSGRSI